MARRLAPGLVIAALASTAAGCGRTPDEQAAVRAQEACIAALDPVARDRRPSADALRSATRNADAAAAEDDRWSPLRDRVHELQTSIDTEAARESLDALVEECRRVNDIVKEKRDDV